MNSEYHRRIEEVFAATVELPRRERDQRLNELCGDDRDLRREVEELLAADDPETQSLWAWGEPVLETVKGTGSYRVLHEIGRGGMGVVFLAERCDGAFQRQVALKILKAPSIMSPDLQRRFRTERQILASLDHPNIARLLDGGNLSNGAPFLVMEYVEGVPIHRFADRQDLSIRAKIELFILVCEAVQAAHQSLVVHRDLKPSNVLVTAEAVPKLLDFGIAKILDPQNVDWTLAETAAHGQPLTPRYASPEQLMAGPITTATDVYALGVLLFELLSGQMPYRPQSQAVHHWIAAVCEQEPRRLSAVIEGSTPSAGNRWRPGRRHPRRRLEGDLEGIVNKALAKEPQDRYATAAELKRDLRNHLDGLPVEARSSRWTYRAGKFLRRYRWGVAMVSVLVALVASFTMSLELQLRRTEVERDKAQTVTDLLVNVLGAAGPSTVEKSEASARELLDHGLEQVKVQR